MSFTKGLSPYIQSIPIYPDDLLECKRTGSVAGGDVRVLVKTTEEMRELRRFTRIFPTPSTHTYLTYLGRGQIAKFWIVLDEVVPLQGQCHRMMIF
jgi:hypothetical protein